MALAPYTTRFMATGPFTRSALRAACHMHVASSAAGGARRACSVAAAVAQAPRLARQPPCRPLHCSSTRCGGSARGVPAWSAPVAATRCMSISAHYGQRPLHVPKTKRDKRAERSEPHAGKDATEAETAAEVEAILGEDLEFGTQRGTHGLGDDWRDTEVIASAMRELEAGRRVQEDTLKALGESKEYQDFNEEVMLAIEAVRAGYSTADERITTQRVTQMQAHVRQVLNATMDKHADKVARDTLDAMSLEEQEALRKMFYRLEEQNVHFEPEELMDREAIMANVEQVAAMMEELTGSQEQEAATKPGKSPRVTKVPFADRGQPKKRW